jgi:hypothetical protein
MTWAEKFYSKRFRLKNYLKKISSQKIVIDDCFAAWDIAFYIVRLITKLKLKYIDDIPIAQENYLVNDFYVTKTN